MWKASGSRRPDKRMPERSGTRQEGRYGEGGQLGIEGRLHELGATVHIVRHQLPPKSRAPILNHKAKTVEDGSQEIARDRGGRSGEDVSLARYEPEGASWGTLYENVEPDEKEMGGHVATARKGLISSGDTEPVPPGSQSRRGGRCRTRRRNGRRAQPGSGMWIRC